MRVTQRQWDRWVPSLYRASTEITEPCFPGTAAGRAKRGTDFGTTTVA
jgi:hypothetical protein